MLVRLQEKVACGENLQSHVSMFIKFAIKLGQHSGYQFSNKIS